MYGKVQKSCTFLQLFANPQLYVSRLRPRVWYRGTPRGRILGHAGDMPAEAKRDAVASCSLGLFSLAANGGELAVCDDFEERCTLCMNCTTLKSGEVPKPSRRCVDVAIDDAVLAFSIATTDALSPHRLMADGIALLLLDAGQPAPERIERDVSEFAAACARAARGGSRELPAPIRIDGFSSSRGERTTARVPSPLIAQISPHQQIRKSV